MDKKLYEMPFMEINRFEVINPLMVNDSSIQDGVDDGEVEEEE